MTTIHHGDARGNLSYPFLEGMDWTIETYSLADEDNILQLEQAQPTLRWVKDGKVLDLNTLLSTSQFLAQTGIELSLTKGARRMSKRLSRIMRPFRYWGIFDSSDVSLDYNADLDEAVWDGAGQISRACVLRIAEELTLTDRQRHELLTCNRFEVTTLHEGGQDKGHVLVVDDLAVDIMFPAGSVKEEIKLMNGRFFIGLHPVHAHDHMLLDMQSLINLYPFFKPEHLIAWAEIESELFLHNIKHGVIDSMMARLYNLQSSQELENLSRWHVGQYLASGGKLMWFAGMVKAMARQHGQRIGNLHKLRCPIPGGRYYIFPADVGAKKVARGQVMLEPETATVWVNDLDWAEFIVDTLGGCDGDDALWVFPFTDEHQHKQVLLWRSPNQLGEYVILEPSAESHAIEWATVNQPITYPVMSGADLPAPISERTHTYGELLPALQQKEQPYTIESMMPAISQAQKNYGVLGGFCNVAMMCKAIYGKLPHYLPASLEDVIDASVKDGRDLTAVAEWNQMAMEKMVADKPIPHILQSRLPYWLRDKAQPCTSHWLDTLTERMQYHLEMFTANTEALAAEACPPAELFSASYGWWEQGKELHQRYVEAFRSGGGLELARMNTEASLNRWPSQAQPMIILGTAGQLYGKKSKVGVAVSDSVVWQLGARQEDGSRGKGIGDLMIQGLRTIGLIGEPIWTRLGAMLHYEADDSTDTLMTLCINGVWFNWLKAIGATYKRMSDVASVERAHAKAKMVEYAKTRFLGMRLTPQTTENNRVVLHTEDNNLFGYVTKGHELEVLRKSVWTIQWAMAEDGNLLAVLHSV